VIGTFIEMTERGGGGVKAVWPGQGYCGWYDSPNTTFAPAVRAMFWRASSCRICMAAGEARICGIRVSVLDKLVGRVSAYIGGCDKESMSA